MGRGVLLVRRKAAVCFSVYIQLVAISLALFHKLFTLPCKLLQPRQMAGKCQWLGLLGWLLLHSSTVDHAVSCLSAVDQRAGKRNPPQEMQNFPRISPCPSGATSLDGSTETWPSGRRRSPAKGVGPEGSRGFESLRLRHQNLHDSAAPHRAVIARALIVPLIGNSVTPRHGLTSPPPYSRQNFQPTF